MHGNSQLQLPVHLDRDGLAIAVQVSALRHDMQRVEQLSHGGSN
jgi:hypothetical protein